MDQKRKWKYRLALFQKQHGRCNICDCKMAIMMGHSKHHPENLACIQHLDTRLDKERGQHPGEQRSVLVCMKCSNELSRKKLATISIEELHARSSGEWERIATRPGFKVLYEIPDWIAKMAAETGKPLILPNGIGMQFELDSQGDPVAIKMIAPTS